MEKQADSRATENVGIQSEQNWVTTYQNHATSGVLLSITSTFISIGGCITVSERRMCLSNQ